MKLGLSRKGSSSALPRTEQADETPPLPHILGWTAELIAANRSCCCSARPVVAVVPDTARSAVLLCGHHFRLHHSTLSDRGAIVYDRDGRRITNDLWPTG